MLPVRAIAGLPLVQVALGAAALIVASLFGLFVPLDNALRDWRFSLASQPASGTSVFVDIDSASLASVGVWPWPRSVHAQILDELMALGAGKVAFDIDFSVASDAQSDAEFERALEDAGGYALLAAFLQQAIAGDVPAVNMPLPRFAQHADPVSVNVNLDPDGIVRSYPLGMWLNGEWVPSIASVFGNLAGGSQGQFVIDYAIDPKTVPRISARDLLAHNVPAEAIAGKQVVIGASAIELRDFFVVPRHGILSGALLQIVALETLFQGRALTTLGASPEVLALLLLACVGLWLRHRPLWAVGVVTITLAIVVESVAAVLHVRGLVLFDTAALHAGLIAIALSSLVAEVRQRGLQHALAARERDAIRVILDRVIADSFDGVVVVQDNGRIVAASQSAVALLGQELTAKAPADALPPALNEAILDCYRRGTSATIRELSIETGDGSRQIEYATTLSEIDVADTRRRIVSLTFRDITERRAAEDRLLYLSRHDPVTGALTRSALLEEAQRMLSAGTALSLLMLDLRRFRAINDTLGHTQGDKLLKLVAERLRNMGPDAVARLGGDSFALLAPAMEAGKLQGYCETVAEWLSFPYQLDDGHRAIVAASAGATCSMLSGIDAETMLSHADMALSEAKKGRGIGVRLFERGMDDRLHASQKMDAALREALRERNLTLLYQPQIDLKTGRVIGAEALSRWTDPTLGIISPADFVPAAEETGLIVELGAWVFEMACRDATTWPEHLRLSVNVSPIQFELSNVPEAIEAALTRSGLDPRRLEIEITEGTFVRSASQATEALQMIRAMGVGIALDDFGTGYSSLGYLGRLPIDTIKIDQRFVRELPGDDESRAIVTAVLSLSRALNKSVVAEGIETRAQADLLRASGCEIGQGYHFGRPMPSAAIIEMASETKVAAFA